PFTAINLKNPPAPPATPPSLSNHAYLQPHPPFAKGKPPMLAATPPKHINEHRLEKDLSYRFQYLAEFMGFTPEDVQTIHAMAAQLAPLVDGLVDAVYVKLFGYDATKRHFVPRQTGYEGPAPTSIEALMLDHE